MTRSGKRKLLRATKHRCWYCGERLPIKKFTKDHVVPRVDGGKNGRANLVPACRRCNHDKGKLSLEEFRELRSRRLGEARLEFYGESVERRKRLGYE